MDDPRVKKVSRLKNKEFTSWYIKKIDMILHLLNLGSSISHRFVVQEARIHQVEESIEVGGRGRITKQKSKMFHFAGLEMDGFLFWAFNPWYLFEIKESSNTRGDMKILVGSDLLSNVKPRSSHLI
jgi:hypothetical protein